MSDPAEQQAAYADLLVELALQRLHPEPLPPQPAMPANAQHALEQLAEAMATMYANRED